MQPITTNERDNVFFLSIWEERAHVCQCGCGKSLGAEPAKYMFHHLLEKRTKTKMKHNDFSKYRYCRWNIWLLAWDCHTSYERRPSTRPIVDERRRFLMLITKDPTFLYDEHHFTFGISGPENNTLIQSLFPNQQLKLE